MQKQNSNKEEERFVEGFIHQFLSVSALAFEMKFLFYFVFLSLNKCLCIVMVLKPWGTALMRGHSAMMVAGVYVTSVNCVNAESTFTAFSCFCPLSWSEKGEMEIPSVYLRMLSIT